MESDLKPAHLLAPEAIFFLGHQDMKGPKKIEIFTSTLEISGILLGIKLVKK